MDGKTKCVKTGCCVCGGGEVFVFAEIADVPIHCNVQYDSYDQAIRARRGDIVLGFCRGCGHIFNVGFEADQMDYGSAYENSLSYSKGFEQYAVRLAEELVDSYRLYGKTIVEIGCGRGDFLQRLCKSGGNSGVGFDPSCQAGVIQLGKGTQISYVSDFYCEVYKNIKADFYCCRHVLEHIDRPKIFIEMLMSSIGRRAAEVYFEVPNSDFMFRDFSVWDLIYEHCSYFSISSLKQLFFDSGFKVLRCERCFGGQFLRIDASVRAGDKRVGRGKGGAACVDEGYIVRFGQCYSDIIENWRKRLKGMIDSGKGVVVWGAGSKGVSFLNLADGDRRIEYVVDVNPNKQGKYVAVGGQLIVSPCFLKDYTPEVVLVMNPIYADEIRQMISGMGLSAQLVSVL